MMTVAAECCANPLCGAIAGLDQQIPVPEVPPPCYSYPVFLCQRCEGYTEVVTQRFKGFGYDGAYYLSYTADDRPYDASESDVWSALCDRRNWA
jgi:hypothetical protein